jgi:iduronate 2-sulfatase
MNDTETRLQRQAYYAAASFMDAQLGKVLLELKASGFEENTVVALLGDHGWHIGENNEWAKHTAMTWANRAPLLFAMPGGTHNVVSESFAEFVDIYPTLADLAGIATPVKCSTVEMSVNHPNCTEGASLGAAVRANNAGDTAAITTTLANGDVTGAGVGGKVAAFGQWPKTLKAGAKMGYNIYTHVPTSLDSSNAQVRYTEWVDYNTSGAVNTPIWQPDLAGITELYNRTEDPNENVNLSELPAMKEIVAALSAQLHAGWRAGAGRV